RITEDQIRRLEEERYKLVSPGVALTLYRYGQLNKEEASNVLAVNHYSQEEIDATMASEFRPPTGLEALNGIRNRRLLGQLNINDDFKDSDIVESITDVREHPGIDDRPGLEELYEFIRGR